MFDFGKKEKILTVEGMTCHHCEMTVEKVLLEIAGVKTAKADHSTKNVVVQYKDELNMANVKLKIEKAGYKLVDS